MWPAVAPDGKIFGIATQTITIRNIFRTVLLSTFTSITHSEKQSNT